MNTQIICRDSLQKRMIKSCLKTQVKSKRIQPKPQNSSQLHINESQYIQGNLIDFNSSKDVRL